MDFVPFRFAGRRYSRQRADELGNASRACAGASQFCARYFWNHDHSSEGGEKLLNQAERRNPASKALTENHPGIFRKATFVPSRTLSNSETEVESKRNASR